jgi:hypothetical protein
VLREHGAADDAQQEFPIPREALRQPVVRSFINCPMGVPIYFPLRSNAASLVKGAPLRSVLRRVKLSALLHDEVRLEEGIWDGQAGPRGAMQWWSPPGARAGRSWQTARERGEAVKHDFMVAMKSTGAPDSAPARPVVQSPTTARWWATFEPLRYDLPRAYPWLLFGHAEISPDGKTRSDEWARIDKEDALIRRHMPVHFHRSMVVDSANLDLMLGAQMGSAVSLDRLHAWIASAKLKRGDARPVFGPHALDILVPSRFEEFDWDDIDELRRHPGLKDYRRILADIEETALDGSSSLDDFTQKVWAAHAAQLHKASERASSSLRAGITVSLVSAVVGEIVTGVLGNLPLVGAAAGLVLAGANLASQAERAGPSRWMAAERAIQARAGASR